MQASPSADTGHPLPTRGALFASRCPSRQLFQHVTSLWAVLILVTLRDEGRLRFSDLRRRAEGVSEKMLAQTLQTLARDGLVERHARPVVPPHVEYTLTPLGQDIAAHVHALVDCVEGNLMRSLQAQVAA
ncbi:winged helix-turn-helix transcriptional regulator [Roseateles sp. LKC17W]|uniref:Winged helix-turn-helix transcriptional regulator n=1 Tax=Pelomonas margarita TaxID=3299031 RepID=A0ABW7FIB7_9BURK